MNQVKTVLAIQVMNSFMNGIVGVAIPLMMKARGIDVVLMGLVFAALPLIFQFGRMVFAVVSDFWGRRLFFISNGALGVSSCLIYFVAGTPLGFLSGKIVEGTKEGALWAVNRPFLLEKNGRDWRSLSALRSVGFFAFAGGSLAAGFLIVGLLFEGTMLFCATLGVMALLLAMVLFPERRRKFTAGKALAFLDLRRKTGVFKKFLLLFTLMGVSLGLTGGFVTTLFLDSNGFNAETIGLIIAVQVLFSGAACYLSSRTMRVTEMILVSGLLFSLAYSMVGFLASILAAAVVVLIGAVQGVMGVTQEGIMCNITDMESYATDIGLLWTGYHVGESISLVAAGFLIAIWGFIAPFILTAATFPLFYVPASLILKKTPRGKSS